jgi:hypothetical protein
MWASLLKAVLEALTGFLRGLAADRRAAATTKDLGATEAQTRLDNQVKEAADAQAENNAADRGGAGGVLKRLRDRTKQNRDNAGT